jgi:hypothetical protein
MAALLSYLTRSRSAALGALAALCMTMPAWAQAPASSLSLVFLEPTGTVGPTDNIPVLLRFSNNDASLPFVVDNALPLGGLDPAMVPLEGSRFDPDTNQYVNEPFASYTNFSLTIGFGCSGSFTTACTGGPPYDFSFSPSPFSQPYSLAAGASLDYLFGTFIPSAGPVAAGTYEFYRSVVWLNVDGLNAMGLPLSSAVFPATTCSFDNAAACTQAGQTFFTRVVEVPEPSQGALLLGGLLALRLIARRRV